jgi:hypothetical protein
VNVFLIPRGLGADFARVTSTPISSRWDSHCPRPIYTKRGPYIVCLKYAAVASCGIHLEDRAFPFRSCTGAMVDINRVLGVPIAARPGVRGQRHHGCSKESISDSDQSSLHGHSKKKNHQDGNEGFQKLVNTGQSPALRLVSAETTECRCDHRVGIPINRADDRLVRIGMEWKSISSAAAEPDSICP